MREYKSERERRHHHHGNEVRHHSHRDHKSHSSEFSERKFFGNGMHGYYKKHSKKSHDGNF